MEIELKEVELYKAFSNDLQSREQLQHGISEIYERWGDPDLVRSETDEIEFKDLFKYGVKDKSKKNRQ